MEISKHGLNHLKQYDTIILCGGIYASGVAGFSILKKNTEKLKDKKIAVFCVGQVRMTKNRFMNFVNSMPGE